MAEQDRRCIVRRWLFGNVDNIVVNTIAACSVGRKLLPRWSQMHLGSLVSDAGQVRRKVSPTGTHAHTRTHTHINLQPQALVYHLLLPLLGCPVGGEELGQFELR